MLDAVGRMVRIPAYCADVVALRGRPTLRCITAPTGRVLTFAEPDYQYGAGPLRLRVERLDRAPAQVVVDPASSGDLWIYAVGPIVGGVVAVVLYDVLIAGRPLMTPTTSTAITGRRRQAATTRPV